MSDNTVSLPPYHIEYNDDSNRYELVLTTPDGMEVVEEAESEQQLQCAE